MTIHSDFDLSSRNPVSAVGASASTSNHRPLAILTVAVLLLPALLTGVRSLRAQVPSTACATADHPIARYELAHVRTLVTRTDARADRAREIYHLPAAPESEVTLVGDPAVCARAGTAYAAAFAGYTGAAPDSVVVVQIRDRYVVLDIAAPPDAGTWTSPVVIFDAAFTKLTSLLM
jgi:hypothetical protein